MSALLDSLARSFFGSEGSGETPAKQEATRELGTRQRPKRKCLVLHGSQGGTATRFASQLSERLNARAAEATNVDVMVELSSLGDLDDPETALVGDSNEADTQLLAFFVVSTFEGGSPPQSARWFARWLLDAANDERVDHGMLRNLHFGVFGLGSSDYEDNFNEFGSKLDKQLVRLGGQRLVQLGVGDEVEAGGKREREFDRWSSIVEAFLFNEDIKSIDVAAAVEGGQWGDEIDDHDDEESDDEADNGDGLVDLEDLAGLPPKEGSHHSNGKGDNQTASTAKKEMWGEAVPLDQVDAEGPRWMLQTCILWHRFPQVHGNNPLSGASEACANKCVFCWRHHTNPVGREWRWQMDPPTELVDGAIELHRKMIKEMRGVPGVKPERFGEAMQVRHCALSLVGEPIMYPRINDFIDELHSRGISSFLVTNAQFPDRIEQLRPVTQLYVSVDAPTKESLKAVDRPLFTDYWDRFKKCLSLLKDKRQRTVYRLTLVKDWNMNELSDYAALVKLGEPDFIEIKGVTYCGDHGSSSLTMKNVPWHSEVKSFSEELCKAARGLEFEYGLACEHAHSCCILLANKKKFLKEGAWHTWIDYDKFQDLIRSAESFGSEDYTARTPSWGVYGSEEAGFDPQDTHFKKERKHKTSASSAIRVSQSGT
eukprot:scaffold1169_cov367-Prasinococcus_capsulatus_cf.AAC.14